AFGVGQDTVHWLATGFIAAMTVSMLLNDWCVRSFGMRNTYIAAMLVFTFGAILGGLSPNVDVMILARILQGSGAGLVQPLSMVLMFQVFPMEQRGKAMGLFGVGVIVAPAVGPTLGGVLLDAYSWPYVFFMSAPAAVAGILLATIFMPRRDHVGPRPAFDWTGFVLIALFIGCLLTGLSNGQREGWQAPIIAVYISVAAFSGVAFILWELNTPNPILQLRLFTNRNFLAAALVGSVLGAGLFGSTYLVPLFVQTIQGYSPTRSGLLMVPGGILMMIAFPIAGRMADRLPRHLLVATGLFVFAFSSILMMQAHTDTPFWTFAIWIMIGRVGLVAVMPTLSVSALSTLSNEMLSQGSGAINFVRQLGGAFGVNLMAVGLQQRTAFFADGYAGLQTPDNIITMDVIGRISHLLGQMGWPFEMLPFGALYLIGQTVYLQASMMAFRDIFLFVALVYFVAMIPAWFLRTPRARQAPVAPLRPGPSLAN
ncbi:MAG: DHA2 family efflux MFS transporter permease subunit, partial [Alphaproteobacteria bacterium]|nr:DHA2 family efflux MFS transporter permease subunit [Alphaproteobacteria bacterium]